MKVGVRNNNLKLQVFILAFALLGVLFTISDARAERLAVIKEIANIRSGPGDSYEVLWQVEKNMPFEILDKDKTGTWYYVKDYEGTIGWIKKSLLSKIDTVVAIPKTECNVRVTPTTDGNISFKAVKGVPFKVMERKGEWLHVQHTDGDEGWIHKSMVW
ncbi:MAG: SH3 domain-containing protein [Desulfosalsimonadaceae bacterium]